MTLGNAQALEMDQLENVAGGGYFHHPDHQRDIELPDAPPPCPLPNLIAKEQFSLIDSPARPIPAPLPEFTAQSEQPLARNDRIAG